MLHSRGRQVIKLSSKLCDRTAMYKDVPGGRWNSCLRKGNNSWLSLVSFGRVLFCILLLWRKRRADSVFG